MLLYAADRLLLLNGKKKWIIEKLSDFKQQGWHLWGNALSKKIQTAAQHEADLYYNLIAADKTAVPFTSASSC